MAFLSRSVVNILCIIAFLCPAGAMAGDDEYLKMLEGEAEDVQLDQTGQLKDKVETEYSASGETITNGKSKDVLEGNIFPPNLNQDEFVALLKQNFYGSFAFYRKLNSIDQQTVYYHYTKASPASLDSIRQEILGHLKNK